MTEDELEIRWKALASVGSSEGKAALAMLGELRGLRERTGKSQTIDNAKYILANIAGMVRLSAAFGFITEEQLKVASIDDFVKVATHLGREALRAANSPPAYAAAGGVGPVIERLVLGTTPEELAAAATRAANGLPATPDPAVTAANPEKPAGQYEKGTGV